MEVSLLTPVGCLFALTALVPLALYRRGEIRARRARAALGLAEPTRRSRGAHVAALVAVCALLGLAAAQPVVATTRTVPERTDAQIFVVVDTSRSMLASAGPDEPTRFDRARELALRIRDAYPEVPVGLASMTDRVLPHLFPSTDRKVLVQTLEDSIGIERPPPRLSLTTVTSLDALAAVAKYSYFAPSTTKRVLVVLSDGESRPVETDLAQAFKRRVPIQTVLVHLWGSSERIYNAGVAEVGYAPDPKSRAFLETVAGAIGARVVDERAVSDVPGVLAGLLGSGPTIGREREASRRSLIPWVTLLAFVPLGYVLFRRNL